MSKPKVNLVVDALMFLCMMAIAGLGLLMEFVLVPGKERVEQYGRHVDVYLFGIDRHEFGEVHFILALVLLVLLAVHIILHWDMIVSIYRRLLRSRVMKPVIAVLLALVGIALLLWPFVPKVEVRDSGPGKRHGYPAVSHRPAR